MKGRRVLVIDDVITAGESGVYCDSDRYSDGDGNCDGDGDGDCRAMRAWKC